VKSNAHPTEFIGHFRGEVKWLATDVLNVWKLTMPEAARRKGRRLTCWHKWRFITVTPPFCAASHRKVRLNYGHDRVVRNQLYEITQENNLTIKKAFWLHC